MSLIDPKSAGLCASCRHVRVVATPRSQFLLCERSRTDPSYARYPRLPMLACAGFERREHGEAPESEPKSREREGN